MFIEPMFIEPVFMPGIWSIGVDVGLGEDAGIFICDLGVGDGVAGGICMPGMSSILWFGEGDAFGVGQGTAMLWPVCCASIGEQAIRRIEIDNKSRTIFIPESVADCLS
jgi:hypothetical protein